MEPQPEAYLRILQPEILEENAQSEAEALATTPATRKVLSDKYYLKKPECWIGRARGCDILVQKTIDNISRKHVCIRINEKHQYLIQDNDSANGTLVNGERLRSGDERLLRTGDFISLGTKNKVFQFINSVDPEFVSLSKAQKQVLELIAQNPVLTYKEIGEKRQMLYKTGGSEHTIKSILREIYARLEVNSSLAAVNRARQLGLID